MVDELTLLRSMIDDPNASDSTLQAYLNIAEYKVLNRLYPFAEDLSDKVVPSRYITTQCEIAAYLYNKRGAEGESAHNENGINRSYEAADVPPSLYNHITPFAGVIGKNK